MTSFQLLEKAKGEDRFGPNAKTAIGTQSEIRKMIAALSEELTQLESMYQTEAKKRKVAVLLCLIHQY